MPQNTMDPQARPRKPGCGAAVIAVLALALAAAGIGGCSAVGVYNGLREKDESVRSSWGNVDAQLQRRLDLIPNLVSTVKGYAKHEEALFAKVTESRERLLAAGTAPDKARADAELNGALGRLLAISENYPDLKANANFIRLQDELAGTENRIAVARTRYNDAVRAYNAAIRKFPASLFAPRMGLEKAEYFRPPAGPAAQTAPGVSF